MDEPSPAKGSKRKTRLRSKILLLLIATFVTLGVVEIGLRIINPFGIEDSRQLHDFADKIMRMKELGYELIPGGRSSYLGHEIEISSQGMRNRETPVAKPDGTFRILVLGDSVAFGWGVAEQDCFPRVVEGLLADAELPSGYDRIEVINAAVPGWNLINGFLFLEEKGMSFEPDLVLLTLIANDVPELDIEGKPIKKREAWKLPRWTQALDLGRFVQAGIDRLTNAPRKGDYWHSDTLPEGGIAHACFVFQKFKDRLKGVPFLVIDTIGNKGGQGLPALVKWCKANDVDRVSAFLWSENYGAEYAVSSFDSHPNAKGHLEIAKPVAEWCRAQLGK